MPLAERRYLLFLVTFVALSCLGLVPVIVAMRPWHLTIVDAVVLWFVVVGVIGLGWLLRSSYTSANQGPPAVSLQDARVSPVVVSLVIIVVSGGLATSTAWQAVAARHPNAGQIVLFLTQIGVLGWAIVDIRQTVFRKRERVHR
jgi:hypothetical protein